MKIEWKPGDPRGQQPKHNLCLHRYGHLGPFPQASTCLIPCSPSNLLMLGLLAPMGDEMLIRLIQTPNCLDSLQLGPEPTTVPGMHPCVERSGKSWKESWGSPGALRGLGQQLITNSCRITQYFKDHSTGTHSLKVSLLYTILRSQIFNCSDVAPGALH